MSEYNNIIDDLTKINKQLNAFYKDVLIVKKHQKKQILKNNNSLPEHDKYLHQKKIIKNKKLKKVKKLYNNNKYKNIDSETVNNKKFIKLFY